PLFGFFGGLGFISPPQTPPGAPAPAPPALAAGFTAVPVTAAGPIGEPVDTAYARRDDLAVIELADVSGLVRLPDGAFAPMTATSRGTGEVIAAAIAAGCRQVVLGIGGSAGTDGGAGLLRALGAHLLDAAGAEIEDGGAALAQLAALDLAALRERTAGVEFTVACDVDNPLLGPRGAAAVYGPQKGTDAAQATILDAALGHWADVVAATTGSDLRDTPRRGRGRRRRLRGRRRARGPADTRHRIGPGPGRFRPAAGAGGSGRHGRGHAR
ncbi:glycerate kinase, partial [Nocardia brasiliensis]|uniref:glycerate kinase n=1 Tax=Nocardia brasiliensis TaxID=37326 RepID=UPI0024558023